MLDIHGARKKQDKEPFDSLGSDSLQILAESNYLLFQKSMVSTVPDHH
jgi:hypothetical protein